MVFQSRRSLSSKFGGKWSASVKFYVIGGYAVIHLDLGGGTFRTSWQKCRGAGKNWRNDGRRNSLG